jgi:hypothetical protein
MLRKRTEMPARTQRNSYKILVQNKIRDTTKASGRLVLRNGEFIPQEGYSNACALRTGWKTGEEGRGWGQVLETRQNAECGIQLHVSLDTSCPR